MAAISDPAAFAIMASRGFWKPFPHLLLIAEKLQQIQHKKCRRLICMLPPRHGKSEFISKYFPAWYLLRNPEKRIILASYEADFASSWGRKARELVEEYGPQFNIHLRQDSHAANRWDLKGHNGGMQTAGVRGPLTGKGGDVLILDDPVKSDEEANSEVYREKTWDWFLATFSTRLHKGGTIIVIQTRWNEDDLTGRILKAQKTGGDKWDVLNLPAIAEKREDFGFLKRKVGDPLCTDLIPHKMLTEIQGRLGDYWWNALYQQRPFPRGGGIFKREAIERIDHMPPNVMRVRGWDLAASKTGKRTAGVLLAKTSDGTYIIENVVTDKLEPSARDALIKRTAQEDGPGVPVKIEQEPGSGGIAQIHSLVRMLHGYHVEGVKVTGDKMTRADPVASQSNVGNMKILDAEWNERFLGELEAFPTGAYMDQVDALSLAFNALAHRSMDAGVYSRLPERLRKNEMEKEFGASRDFGFDRKEDWHDSLPI
jgi:predicted phage terminase large subunit-like protein